MGPTAAANPDEPGWPDGLLEPSAYPNRSHEITLATTHCSWVFITDALVYKIKRPVRLGFLDYSTVERRRRACEEEVRLGQRLAPGVYRGVVPVHAGKGGFSFRGGDRVVDWAVCMERLPDEASALARLRAGHLGPADLDRLARTLARFYRRAPAAPRYGMPPVWAVNVGENFDQIRPFVGRFLSVASFDALRGFHQGFLVEAGERLTERVAEGRIRDGHGDLRLEHVYFLPDAGSVAGREPVVIDPIEFAERFRCADIALDFAFLAMELAAEGRVDLAEIALAAFARENDDYGFYPLADFYMSYRATVRGKVACFVAGEPSTPADKARRKGAEAARLFSLAETLATARRKIGPVVVVGGLPGTGKSSIAEMLGRHLATPVVSADRTGKFLAGIDAFEHGPSEIYEGSFSRRAYDELFRRAQCVLDGGRAVILDGTFRSTAVRGRARALAARNRRPFLFVEAVCDDVTLRRRLRERSTGSSVSDADEAVLEVVRQGYEPVRELPGGEYVVLTTTDATPDELAERIARIVPAR